MSHPLSVLFDYIKTARSTKGCPVSQHAKLLKVYALVIGGAIPCIRCKALPFGDRHIEYEVAVV
jgi:hypothetical protein